MLQLLNPTKIAPLWQMKEFGVEDSWTQFLKISYQNLQIAYRLDDVFQVFPLCLSENGGTLILVINNSVLNIGDQEILYNWRNNRVKKIENTYRIIWKASKGYVESLVSTC
ncbi:hypothetical protein MtrunA17_Chr6g0468721 [Medicago truncatula]|uniref:Uncharacterized protein n=1 Tax=Medicago truncatula TaxID=3880 RepID=A0A396HFU6_MEDTR|nr:hypothetical protein MtrunA17_Chr6g0468721 [Medicago truncatula]